MDTLKCPLYFLCMLSLIWILSEVTVNLPLGKKNKIILTDLLIDLRLRWGTMHMDRLYSLWQSR